MRRRRPIPEPPPIPAGEPAKPAAGSWPGVADLPDPRPDGRCARCGDKEAVTRDGRFCKKCLHELVVKLTPGSIVPRGINRTDEQRQGFDDGSPWGENNVRALEGD